VQAREGGGDRDAKLRARAEAGMLRDGLDDGEIDGRGKAERILRLAQIGDGPLGRASRGPGLRCRAQADARADPLDRQAEAAEPAAEPAMQVEKAEMKARRGKDLDAEDLPGQRFSSSNIVNFVPANGEDRLNVRRR
jgi:hypothetical protein